MHSRPTTTVEVTVLKSRFIQPVLGVWTRVDPRNRVIN